MLDQLAFLVAVFALGAAGFRLAAAATTNGLERCVAALVLAAAAAVGWSLLLGLAGAGSSSVALLLSALATWLATRLRLSSPEPRPFEALVAFAQLSSVAELVAIGALAGVITASAVFFLVH